MCEFMFAKLVKQLLVGRSKGGETFARVHPFCGRIHPAPSLPLSTVPLHLIFSLLTDILI